LNSLISVASAPPLQHRACLADESGLKIQAQQGHLKLSSQDQSGLSNIAHPAPRWNCRDKLIRRNLPHVFSDESRLRPAVVNSAAHTSDRRGTKNVAAFKMVSKSHQPGRRQNADHTALAYRSSQRNGAYQMDLLKHRHVQMILLLAVLARCDQQQNGLGSC
jgi:hypothetical protein